MINNSAVLPDEGSLQISVFLGDVGQPLPDARVLIAPSGGGAVIDELVTDESGQTPVVNLPAPPIEYSLYVNQPKPYSEYDLTVLVDGREVYMVRGVQIFPHTRALQNIVIDPVLNPGAENVIDIKPHTLWGVYPPKIPEDEVKDLPPSQNFVVLPAPVVPEFVVVHGGAPTNSGARDYWVTYRDYIKNVASSEIYPTWPYETLKANILAIMSFTMNRIYTEWYRGKGFPFTITNSTAFDQAFTYGRNIYAEISRIVDENFNTFITRGDQRQPLFAQYCDGQRVQCPNWLSQWGSKYLGDQGYNHFDILRRYYGGDIFLMQAPQVEGIPSSYPGYAQRIGSAGPAVRTIQQQLNAIAANFPAIPTLAVDGIFGPNTRAAVQRFQSIFNLAPDGVVGVATWFKLSDVYVAVRRLAEGRPR